jgi:outer membrane protein
LRLTQPLYDSQASYNLKEARIQWEQLRLSVQQEICNVLFQVREAYDEIVLYQAQLAIDQSIIQIWEEELTRQKCQVEWGTSISFEMNQTQLNLKKAWMDFYETQKKIHTIQYVLLTILGLPPQTPLHLQDNALCLPVADWQQEDFKRWMQWAFCYRPELRLEQFNLLLAQNKVKQTKAENYPTVNLYANAGHHYVSNGFDNQPSIAVGVNVDWTLWNFSTKQKVRAAQASRQEASSRYCQTELETEAVIYNEWSAIQQSYRAYSAAHEGALLAQEGIQMAKKKHQHGVMTAFEYRDAVKMLREAEQRVNQAKFDLRRAYYLLVRQAGVDLIPAN